MSITDGTVICGLCGEALTGCSLCGEAPLVDQSRAIAERARRDAESERELDRQSAAIARAAWLRPRES